MPVNLDEVALASLEAILEEVDKSQVDRLIEIYEVEKEKVLIMAFIARQVGRGHWGKPRSYLTSIGRNKISCSAARLYKVLSQCRNDEVKIALGFFKWFYEAGKDRRSILRKLREEYKITNASQSAPSGFVNEYLKTILGLK